MTTSAEPDATTAADGADGSIADGAATLRPGDWQLVAWRSFLRAHAHLISQLAQDLQDHHEITLASYDVLVQLAEAPDNRLRMSELADAVLLSRSGLTRLVDRLQHDELVVRERDPGDARGLFTVLTTAGRDALREASAVHLAGVQAKFVDRLTDEELQQLHALMAKIDQPDGADGWPSPPSVPSPRVRPESSRASSERR